MKIGNNHPEALSLVALKWLYNMVMLNFSIKKPCFKIMWKQFDVVSEFR